MGIQRKWKQNWKTRESKKKKGKIKKGEKKKKKNPRKRGERERRETNERVRRWYRFVLEGPSLRHTSPLKLKLKKKGHNNNNIIINWERETALRLNVFSPWLDSLYIFVKNIYISAKKNHLIAFFISNILIFGKLYSQKINLTYFIPNFYDVFSREERNFIFFWDSYLLHSILI